MAASREKIAFFIFWKRERGSTVFSDFLGKIDDFSATKIAIFAKNRKNLQLSQTRTEIFEKVDYIGNFSKKKKICI